MSSLLDRVSTAATDEILTTIENGGTGLYWIDDHWSVSCQLRHWTPGTPRQGAYYEADLNYQREETSIPEQIAYRDTESADETELFGAIRTMLRESLYTITETNHLNGTLTPDGIFPRLIDEQKRKNAEICVSCGEIIPEGRQICPRCERRY